MLCTCYRFCCYFCHSWHSLWFPCCHHGHSEDLAETLPHSYQEGVDEGNHWAIPVWLKYFDLSSVQTLAGVCCQRSCIAPLPKFRNAYTDFSLFFCCRNTLWRICMAITHHQNWIQNTKNVWKCLSFCSCGWEVNLFIWCLWNVLNYSGSKSCNVYLLGKICLFCKEEKNVNSFFFSFFFNRAKLWLMMRKMKVHNDLCSSIFSISFKSAVAAVSLL